MVIWPRGHTISRDDCRCLLAQLLLSMQRWSQDGEPFCLPGAHRRAARLTRKRAAAPAAHPAAQGNVKQALNGKASANARGKVDAILKDMERHGVDAGQVKVRPRALWIRQLSSTGLERMLLSIALGRKLPPSWDRAPPDQRVASPLAALSALWQRSPAPLARATLPAGLARPARGCAGRLQAAPQPPPHSHSGSPPCRCYWRPAWRRCASPTPACGTSWPTG